MAKKLSGYPDAGTLTGDELVPVIKGGKNKRTTVTTLLEGAADAIGTAVADEAAARAAADSALAAAATVRPANPQVADYTLVLGDAGKAVEVTSATARNITVPPNSSVAYPLGTLIEVAQAGAGAVTLVPGASVTFEGGVTTPAQGGSLLLRKLGTNNWRVVELAPRGTYVQVPTPQTDHGVRSKANPAHPLNDYFGAIGDGTSHPLSERYGSLGAAQAFYGSYVTSLTQQIDWAAWMKMLTVDPSVQPTLDIVSDARVYRVDEMPIERPNVRIRGVHGIRPNSYDVTTMPDGGTKFLYVGAAGGVGTERCVFRLLGVEGVVIDGVHGNGQSIANTGFVIIDTDNSPAAHEIDLGWIAADSFGTLGTDGFAVMLGTTLSSLQMDASWIKRLHSRNCTTGVIYNSVNTDTAIIEQAYISGCKVGVRYNRGGYMEIARLAVSATVGTVGERCGILVDGDHGPILVRSYNVEPATAMSLHVTSNSATSGPITFFGGALSGDVVIDANGQTVEVVGAKDIGDVHLNGGQTIFGMTNSAFGSGKSCIRTGSGSQFINRTPSAAAPFHQFESNGEGVIADFKATDEHANPGISITNAGAGGAVVALLAPGTGGVNPGGASVYVAGTKVINVEAPHVNNTLRLVNGIAAPASLQVIGNVGFYNTSPAAKPGSTADIKAGLGSLGLLTTGGATPLDLEGGLLKPGSTKERVNTIAASGAAQTIDVASGNVVDLTLTADCTLTLAGSTSGLSSSLTFILRQDGTGTRLVTWPASVKWPGAIAPTLTTTATTGVDVVTLFTVNGGTSWLGFPSGIDMR